MNYFTIPGCCCIFLLITACDSQAQISPVSDIPVPGIQQHTASLEKAVVTRDIAIEKTAREPAVPGYSRQPLNLSIDDVLLAEQSDKGDMFFNDDDVDADTSALFDGLSRKYPDHRLKLSGELLTDENEYETKYIYKSVNGVQINVQGQFN